MARRPRKPKSVETLVHDEATRRNIPTAEYHPVMTEEDKAPVRVAYKRRNRDLDPQLVWRGKDLQDAADLVVQAPPLYIQERHLLYVACTRARDHLLVTGVEPASEFLDDLRIDD